MANKLSLKNRKPLRHQFGVLQDIADMPNLIEIQKSSYRQLLTSKTEENKCLILEYMMLYQAFFQ